ncbi:MAG: hypothetical protein ABJA80_08425 [bacterium]
MRTYVVTTGVIFALLAIAHVFRVVQEGQQVATNPFFAGITVAAAAMSVWAWRVLRAGQR